MVILVHASLVAVKKEDAFKILNVYRAVDTKYASYMWDCSLILSHFGKGDLAEKASLHKAHTLYLKPTLEPLEFHENLAVQGL